MACFACSILRNACCNIFHDRKTSETDGDVGNEWGGTVACYSWLFLAASQPSCRGLVPISGGIFKLLFASGHTPRTPNGWAACSANKPHCSFKLVALASHRRNRARFPRKSPPSWSWRTREERYPMTPKTAVIMPVRWRAMFTRVQRYQCLLLYPLFSAAFPTLRFQLFVRENEAYRLRQSAHPFRGGE